MTVILYGCYPECSVWLLGLLLLLLLLLVVPAFERSWGGRLWMFQVPFASKGLLASQKLSVCALNRKPATALA